MSQKSEYQLTYLKNELKLRLGYFEKTFNLDVRRMLWKIKLKYVQKIYISMNSKVLKSFTSHFLCEKIVIIRYKIRKYL